MTGGKIYPPHSDLKRESIVIKNIPISIPFIFFKINSIVKKANVAMFVQNVSKK